MHWSLIVLACWVFIWFLPSFLVMVWQVRQKDDIVLGDLLLILCITLAGGPLFFLILWMQNLYKSGFLETVVIKRCKYRKAWDTLRNTD